MTILNILHYPDPRLRHTAQPIAIVDHTIDALIADMFETMYDDQGIGLAATQVNVAKQIIIMDFSDTQNQPLCFINPKIIQQEGIQVKKEGCLSVPGIFELIERAERITVTALDRHGKSFELKAEGLLAVCIQHEMDHLNGKLFIDYLSPLKRQRLQKKVAKLRRETL